MLLVKTKIGPSTIHGTGLFADEFIPKGTITWKYDQGLDLGITKEQLETLSPVQKEYFLYYTYYDEVRKLHILPIDHLKFINHSSEETKRNIESTPNQDVASRDIQPGDEFLCDYNKFDPGYFARISLATEDIK